MKQTLTAVALAAGVLAAMPAWAQSAAPAAPSAMPNASGPITHVQPAPEMPSGASRATMPEPAANAAASETGAGDEAEPTRHAARSHHRHRHAAHRTREAHRTGRRGGSPSDTMANRLNRQEVERGAAGVAPMPQGTTMGGPRGMK